jgi:hypothetical protein
MAKLVRKETGYEGGIEDKMSTLAGIFLILNIATAVICIIVFFSSLGDFSKMEQYRVISIVMAIACAISGTALYIILEAGAEIVRLLKKQNGIRYSGDISQANKPIYSYACSNCGAVFGTPYINAIKQCHICKEAIEVTKEPKDV